MNDKPVHERISGRVANYVIAVGRSFSPFYIENLIKEELAPLEAQLQEADTTATAMGLALTEVRMENEQLRACLEGMWIGVPRQDGTVEEVCCCCGNLKLWGHKEDCEIKEALANTSGKEGA